MEFDGSAVLKRALDALGLGHPIRYSMGASCGLLAKWASGYWATVAPQNATAAFLVNTHAFYFILLGVVVAFLPMVLAGRRLSENTTRQIDTIEELLERGDFSKSGKRAIWREVTDKYVKAIDPQSDVNERDLKKLLEESSAQGTDRNPPAV